MTRRVLVVGGGPNQVPLVMAAKGRNHFVVVSDVNEDPPCRRLADEYEQVDTTDRLGTLRAAQRHRVDAVVTDQSDAAVPTTAFIADEFGIPGIGYETALRFTVKSVMRLGIPESPVCGQPRSEYFVRLEEAVRSAEERLTAGGKLVVKPINSQGSKGVAILMPQVTRRQIGLAFSESRGQGVLLEERIVGDEYSVEAFVVDGSVHNLVATKKYHHPENDCIDVRNTFLGDIPAVIEEKLFAANRFVLETLGLRTGSAHGEYIVTRSGEVFLMEIAARGGGGNISGKIVPFLTDFVPSEALLDFATGVNPVVRYADYRKRYAILRFFNFPCGRISRLERGTLPHSGLLHFELNVGEGSMIRPVVSSRERPGYFIVGSETRGGALELEEAVSRSVKVTVGGGANE